MSGDDEILRRHFIAIATHTFEANDAFVDLDVDQEVAVLRAWLTDEALADRRFRGDEFADLAHDPSHVQVEQGLTERRKFTDADAVVVYVTSHGFTAYGMHRIALHQSNPATGAKSIRTVELVEWLAAHQGLDQVLLILDVCEAGQAIDDLTGQLRRALPREWVALMTAPSQASAKLAAFSGVLESVIDEVRTSSDPSLRADPYLDSGFFVGRLKRRLWQEYGQDLEVLQHPYEPSVCLPNPGYDADRFEPTVANRARRDLAVPAADMASHWAVRAPVEAGAGAVFTGRARLMKELIAAATGAPATLVMSGRAGSGKSAALARLVTCSDPGFRREHASVLAVAQPVPPENAVDVAVLATGKTAEQIAQQIGCALGADGPDPVGATALDGWVHAILGCIAATQHPLTLVLDALDEAVDPGAVVQALLARISPRGQPRMRLLVGVRSSGDADTAVGVPEAGVAEAPQDFAAQVAQILGARRISVDGDELWEPDDVRGFVVQVLTQGDSPYSPAEAADVALVIEQSAARSYLLAGLNARALARLDHAVSAQDPELLERLADGPAQILAEELRAAYDDPRDRRRALTLLRASALAEGRGVPVREIWPLLATAISPDHETFGDSDVEAMLRHRLSGYLVRDVEDQHTVYRPFHEELRRALAEGVDVDGGAGQLGVAEAQRRIAWALRSMVRWEAA